MVFTTDHGELQGDFGLLFKGPYHVDGLMRLPLVWRPAPRAAATPSVVTRPVGDISDLATIGLPIRTRAEFIEQITQRVHHLQIGLFIPAADVIHLAQASGRKDPANGTAVILDVEPVTNLLTIAINWQRLTRQRVVDHQRNELFREMEGAIIVGAIGGQHWQTIGVVVGTHQVVGRRLARRVGTVRLVAVGFTECGRILFQRAIDFICGDMQETEGLPLRIRKSGVIGADSFEQAEGADNVGLDEIFRPVDGAVDMRFCSEVDHRAWLMFCQQAGQQIGIGNAAMDEHMASITGQASQILQIAGIGQGIEIEHRFIALRQPVENEIAANKTSTAGDKNHDVFLTARKPSF